MIDYKEEKLWPIKIAKGYLKNDHTAIELIESYCIDFDGWPITVNGEANTEKIRLECYARANTIL